MARTAPDANARYREAYKYGSRGRPLPAPLSDLADQDPLVDVASDAGASRVPFEDFLRDNGLLPAQPPTPSKAPAAPKGGSSSGGSKFASVGENLGAILLGLLAGALVLSVFDYGPKGPLYWFEAKYLNDSIAPSGSSSSSSSSTSTGPQGTAANPTGPAGPVAPNVETG